MGELFWNKVFGAILGTALVLFGMNVVSAELEYNFGSDSHGYYDDEHHGDVEGEKSAGARLFPGFPDIWKDLDVVGAAPVEVERIVDYGVLLRQANAETGQSIFQAICASCHSVGPDAAHGQGPRMWDTVNLTPGTKPGFGYSDALRARSTPWTYEELDKFLERPTRYVRGTSMNYNGLNQEAQRMHVIMYLRSLSDNPAPLPAPLPEETEEPAAEGEAADAGEADATQDAVDAAETDAEMGGATDASAPAPEAESADAEASETDGSEAGDDSEGSEGDAPASEDGETDPSDG